MQALNCERAGRAPDVDDGRRRAIARLRSNWVVRALRRAEPFRELGRGPWQAFELLARFWTPSSAWAWPSQKRLAEHMGVSDRSVRSWTEELEHRGIIVRRFETLDDGRTRIYYAPGVATFAALEALELAQRVVDFPASAETASDSPRKPLPTPPEMVSADLNPNLNKDPDRAGVRAREDKTGTAPRPPSQERASPQGNESEKIAAPSARVPSARSHLTSVPSSPPRFKSDRSTALERSPASRAMEEKEQTADQSIPRSTAGPRPLFADLHGAMRVLEALEKSRGKK
jgi:hypothetical protein